MTPIEEHVANFLAERCALGGVHRTWALDLWAAYLDWVRERGEGALTRALLGRRLTGLGVSRWNSNGRTYYVGLRLK